MHSLIVDFPLLQYLTRFRVLANLQDRVLEIFYRAQENAAVDKCIPVVFPL
jgi:hypothetical protein